MGALQRIILMSIALSTTHSLIFSIENDDTLDCVVLSQECAGNT